MVLEVENQIILSTRFGNSVVQLLLGDITDLSVDDKVDIVFTSAFPGDYFEGIPSTLIYALKQELDISVGRLARDKDLDLRENFSCWLSKPLPSDKPFKRLACFEVLRNQNMTEQISMMFRAIMPIFNGKESSIITPPLATGCQGAPIEGMVNVMVNSACHWIKAGLPLTCLKLVLFTRNIKEARSSEYKRTITLFKGLKATWEQSEKVKGIGNYDVTFCYHYNNLSLVNKVKVALRKEGKKLKIHDENFKMNETVSWQEEVFQLMANSKRIVIVLTPSFVSDKWCLEQFNMGLCCNRLRGEEVIIPFYMMTVEIIPSYMNLVQYRECRVRKDGETIECKITEACCEVIKSITTSSVVNQAQLVSPAEIENAKQVQVYDVFVSYSHRTPQLAQVMVETLKRKYPNLHVFLDKRELKSGNIWQQALYEAVDQAHSMIAFLSDAYIKSTVCQEEYHIALGRMKAKDKFLLVPVYLPELSELPTSYAPISPVKVSTLEDIEGLVQKIMPSVERIISGKDDTNDFDVNLVKRIKTSQRFKDFKKKFKFDEGTGKIVQLNNTINASVDIKGTVVFAYGSNGLKFTASLSESLRQDFPNIKGKPLSYIQSEAREEIDCADIVVIFVSDEFLWAQHHVEELHIALCRQRAVKDSTIVYLVEVEHECPTPFYLNLLPFNVCIDDPMWKQYAKTLTEKSGVDVQRYVVKTSGMEGTYMCSNAEHLALTKMKLDIVDLLSQRGQGSSLPTNLINIGKTEQLNKGKMDENLTLSEVPTLAAFSPGMLMKNQGESAKGTNENTGAKASAGVGLGEEEEMSPEERAKVTFSQHPVDPADEIISEMNKFLITTYTPEKEQTVDESINKSRDPDLNEDGKRDQNAEDNNIMAERKNKILESVKVRGQPQSKNNDDGHPGIEMLNSSPAREDNIPFRKRSATKKKQSKACNIM